MKNTLIAGFCVAAFVAGGVIGYAQGQYGYMPDWWAGWSVVSVGPHIEGHPSSLGGVVGQVQHDAMPNGGPQGLEGYVYDDHQAGTTRLTFGLVSNVELAGAGHTQEVRSSGGVVTGPARVSKWDMNGGSVHNVNPSAQIDEICGLCPQWSGNIVTKRGVWLPADTQANRLPGTTDVETLRFSNGWTISAAGDTLEIRDRNGVVRRW
jgi:hypothetical protein